MILAVININIKQYDQTITPDADAENLPQYQQAKTYKHFQSASQLGDTRAHYYLGWLTYPLNRGAKLENT